MAEAIRDAVLRPPRRRTSFRRARLVQDRGGRAALHSLRRGGSGAAPVHGRARAGRRDREGVAAAALAFRRAAGAVLSPRPGASRGPGRAGDGHRRAHRGRARRPARRAARRSARRRAAATRCCGCSTRPRRIRPPTTCCAATWRCSTARSRQRARASDDGAAGLATALAFRLKLALAAGFSPELAACARCGEADGLTGFSGAARRGRLRRVRAGWVRALREAHRFMVEALGSPLAQAPIATTAGAAPGRARGHRDARAPRARAPARRGLSRLPSAPLGHHRSS